LCFSSFTIFVTSTAVDLGSSKISFKNWGTVYFLKHHRSAAQQPLKMQALFCDLLSLCPSSPLVFPALCFDLSAPFPSNPPGLELSSSLPSPAPHNFFAQGLLEKLDSESDLAALFRLHKHFSIPQPTSAFDTVCHLLLRPARSSEHDDEPRNLPSDMIQLFEEFPDWEQSFITATALQKFLNLRVLEGL
jgi:hypothetical protein